MEHFDYCVAIRTLGTAGKKYQTLLDSLKSQTIQAKHIFVYIAEGYEIPQETIGIEEYIRTPKGMIAQRSFLFNEIDTDFVLFCDDDLYLPNNFVEKMFIGMFTMNGDCIAANVYNHHNKSFFSKVSSFLHNFTTPRIDDNWCIRIKRDVSFSYNISPKADYLLTESASGACFLCKLGVYKSIHFEDERWLDRMGYAAGDDQLFFYKMYLKGYRILQFLNSGLIHLDAQTGHGKSSKNKMFLQKKNMFIMWYRTIFCISTKSSYEKGLCILAFVWRCLLGILFLPLEVLYYKQPRFFIDYFRGLFAGYKFVRSSEYKRIPSFDAYNI